MPYAETKTFCSQTGLCLYMFSEKLSGAILCNDKEKGVSIFQYFIVYWLPLSKIWGDPVDREH